MFKIHMLDKSAFYRRHPAWGAGIPIYRGTFEEGYTYL